MSKSPADDVVSIYREHADAFVRQRGTGLIAWYSFFHLSPEDQRGMFGEFGRLAAPGAVLMFTSGPGLGEAIGEFEGRPLYHGSLDGAEYRELLGGVGLRWCGMWWRMPGVGGRRCGWRSGLGIMQ